MVTLNYQEPTVVVDPDVDLSSQLITMGAIHTIKNVGFFPTCSTNGVTEEFSSFSFFSFPVYSMAQASKAIIPKDVGGPFGSRIGVSVSGSLGWALRVGAYVTGRVSSSDWLRYSIVVMNCKFQFNPSSVPGKRRC